MLATPIIERSTGRPAANESAILFTPAIPLTFQWNGGKKRRADAEFPDLGATLPFQVLANRNKPHPIHLPLYYT